MSDTSESRTFSATEWRIIGITSVAHWLCHFGELAFAAVIGAVMAEFELGPDRAAALMVPGLVLYGVGAIPAGLWADRCGPRQVLSAFFVLLTLAATAVSLSRTVWQLGAALTLLGLAISLYHPAGLTMISCGCQQRGRAMGINGVAGSLGVALGPALGLLLASQGHWRATYALIAVASVVAGVASMMLPIELPVVASREAKGSRRKSVNRALIAIPLLFVAMLLGGINYRCLTTALPTYLSRMVGTENEAARDEIPQVTDRISGDARPEHRTPSALPSGGGIVFLVFSLGGIGQFVGGYLSDKFPPARIYTVAILLTVPCALVMAHGGVLSVTIAGALLAIFMFAQQPLENVMIAEATPMSWRSTIYGLKFVLAFGLASSGAYLTGWVWKQYGLATVFDVFAGIALGMAVFAALYAWRCLGKSPSQTEAGNERVSETPLR